MALMDAASLQKLSELLKPQEDEDEVEQASEKATYLTPGTIGQSCSSQKTDQESAVKAKKTDDKDIWDADEINEGNFDDDSEQDDRPCPEYEVLFKQKVTTDDIFLGMTSKNQSTACCEDLLVKIHLPDTERAEIELDVQETFISCRSPKFRLALHLPSKVDSKNGKADWDRSKRTLEVTLPLDREYDFMNF